jgi:large subunit ribosomal protein L4
MKAQDGQVMIVDDFTVTEPKTKNVFEILQALSLEGRKTLLLVPEYDANLWRAGRNIPNLRIMEAQRASTYDILNNQTLLIQAGALPVIEKSFTRI